MNLRLTKKAERDLAAVRSYTVERFGHAQAIRYRGQIENGFATIRSFPFIGMADVRLKPGYQAYRVAHHWVV